MKPEAKAASLILASLFLLAPGPAIPETAKTTLQPGQPAPPIQLESVLQAPPGEKATWADLQGKAVVLEFWATWCGACVMAFPGLNELEAKLASEPIRFIAITDEDEALVRKFLERRPIRGWIGIDHDRSMFEAYGAKSLPQTVLVDAGGVIRAITHPTYVKEAALRALIAGEALDIPPMPDPFEEGEDDPATGAARPLYEISIRPAGSNLTRTTMNRAGFEGRGISLRSLVSQAYGFPSTRIQLEEGVPEFRYDVVVQPAGNSERVAPLMREAIETALQVEVRTRRIPTGVYILQRIAGAPSKLSATGGGAESWSTGPGAIEGVNMTIATLSEALEAALDWPVVDGSRLRGNYDIRLKWDASQPDSLPARVEQELGLKLTTARRKVEFLVVSPRADPGKQGAVVPGSPEAH